MYIDSDIDSYIVFEETSISDALAKLTERKQKILFVVNSYHVVLGAFTDGDFRRWVLNSETINLSLPVIDIAHRPFVYAYEWEKESKLAELFSERISTLPLVDEDLRITGVAKPGTRQLSIGKNNLNENAKSLIIAEIGNNHNGSLSEAKRLVDSAIASGADCVKFQMRDLDTLYVNKGQSDDPAADLGTQYVLDLLLKNQLSDEEFNELFQYCRQKEIPVLCTPFDLVSADKLERMKVEAYKVASADLTNHALLEHLCKKDKPLIVSTGMSTEEEIVSSIELLRKNNANFVLLHCNSTYPCPFDDVNLKYLQRLRELSGDIVGYSGHERGGNIAKAAVALGAKIIEKHFTHDQTQEGNDHKISLLPDEFRKMVQGIREIESSLGHSNTRTISQGEMINRETLAKSIVAAQDISRGDILHESMLSIMSPGKGLAPCYMKYLVGRIAKRNIKKLDFFYDSDLTHNPVKPREYSFKNRFGLPVRYHDFEKIISLSNLDFIEFHLSYKDLDENFEQFLHQNSYDIDCLVHAPELFAGDHILDLCSENEQYRQQSIGELQRVIDLANSLKKYFNNNTENILIVVNVGGFTKDTFLSEVERSKLLEILIDSFDRLQLDGVELLPQTMPPYPWHFGGQQYHNLFVDPRNIAQWCGNTHNRICLDISHTALSCNYLNIQLGEALDLLSNYTAHLHIADASGTKQEGLQIGEGDVDFLEVISIIERRMPNACWLPEVWQGHKNNGEGFWIAFDRLESIKKSIC